jgi:hypothetical protein
MIKRDDLLFPLGLNLKHFLVIYNEANKLKEVPSPTINHDIQFVFDAVNGVAPSNQPQQQLLLRENGKDDNDGNVGGDVDVKDVQDKEMSTIKDKDVVEGNNKIRHLTYNTIVRSIYYPIEAFYDKCKMNKEYKKINAAMEPIWVNESASRNATVL